MRLPRECHQMQQIIETHLPHLSQPQLTGLAWWVCGAILAGSGPERRGLGPLALGQMEQPPPVSPRVALRRQRPGPSLPDPTGCNPLLRAPAPLGPGLVAFRTPRPGRGPHPQRRPDHRHRHQRSLPQLRHPRGLAHPARQPVRLLDGPHRGTAQGTGPSGSQGNDRHRALRPGHRQSQALEANTRSGLASRYALPEEHHFLRRWRTPVARPALCLPS